MNKIDTKNKLSENADYRAFRGNSIWIVRDRKIIYHKMEIQEDKNWIWNTKEEGEFDLLNCPTKYFDITDEIDPEWRSKVLDFANKYKEIKEEIRREFKSCSENEMIEVILFREGYRLTFNRLNIEYIRPGITGRASDGRLFKVPLNRVVEINKVPKRKYDE